MSERGDNLETGRSSRSHTSRSAVGQRGAITTRRVGLVVVTPQGLQWVREGR